MKQFPVLPDYPVIDAHMHPYLAHDRNFNFAVRNFFKAMFCKKHCWRCRLRQRAYCNDRKLLRRRRRCNTQKDIWPGQNANKTYKLWLWRFCNFKPERYFAFAWCTKIFGKEEWVGKKTSPLVKRSEKGKVRVTVRHSSGRFNWAISKARLGGVEWARQG